MLNDSAVNSGRDLDDLAEELKEDREFLSLWEIETPVGYSYSRFSIAKHDGRRRWIDAPSDSLKALQQKIYKKFLKFEAYQTAATGFVRGRSIYHNARPHLKARILIKIDLRDFFTTTSEGRVFKFWQHHGWNSNAAKILTNICCINGGLPQGAPTSPALSNVVNRAFDGRVTSMVESYGVEYTRYADDLTFSFRKTPKNSSTIRSLIRNVKKLVQKEGYEIQYGKKIKILRPHQRQIVTGLLVNEKINLPRKTRNLIRALRHLRKLRLLSDADLLRLKGYEDLLNMIHREDSESTKNVREIAKGDAASLVVHGDFFLNSEVRKAGDVHGPQIIGDGSAMVNMPKDQPEAVNRNQLMANKIAKVGIIISTLLVLLSIVTSLSQSQLQTWICEKTSFLCKTP